MPRHRIAIIGLGMAVTPHAKSLIDLKDRIDVAHAFSPSEARRKAFNVVMALLLVVTAGIMIRSQ